MLKYDNLSISYPEIAHEWDYIKNGKLTPDSVAPHSDIKAWWICKNGHSYYSKIDGRTRMNAGCPYCAGKKPLPGVTDLKTVYPEIAQEWDYANNESSPEQYMPKSNKVVSWICPICKESYRRKVIERTGKGFGCKNCMGETHTSRQEQSLIYYLSQVINVENRAKRLDKELDVYIPSLNTGIEYNGEYYHKNKSDKDTQKVLFLRSKGVRVIVIQCGRIRSVEDDTITLCTKENCNPSDEEFEWGIKSTFKVLGLQLPDISLKRDMVDIYGLYIKSIKENSIADKYPEIAKEWNYELNKSLKPESFAYASNKKVWWKCSVCGSDYNTSISNRTTGGNGCPYCAGKRVKPGFNDIATTHPQLIENWNYDKNTSSPEEYNKGSDKKVWWLCHKCGYEWQASISSRVSGTGCPVCAGRVVLVGYNNLGLKDGTILRIWNYGKNNILPSEVTDNSNKIVWWKCDNCGNEWKASICSITRGRRCPECAKKNRPTGRNRTLIEKQGSLADNFPELLDEWDYGKNSKSPSEYLSGSDKKVWWICKRCGNSYMSTPYRRTYVKTGCPECGKNKSVASRNSLRLEERGTLQEHCPELLKEWDYEKNEQGPECFTKGSNKKVWWKCKKGHSWEANINSRVQGHGCPICAGRVRCKNLDTGEVFDNYSKAARSVGVTRNAITFAIKKNRLCKGYRWAIIE